MSHRALVLSTLALLSCGDPSSPFPSLSEETRNTQLAERTDAPFEVIVDTDLTNEIDDQFALAYALSSPEAMRVLAITAAPYGYSVELFRDGHGTSELDLRVLEADLRAAGIDPESVPRFSPVAGVQRAFEEAGRWVELLDADIPEGVHRGAPLYLPNADEPVESDAADAIIRIARAHDGPVHVLCMGALTNVASALLLAPDLVEKIVVVWTSAYPSFWPEPNASFNLAQDVHAAHVVLESGVPLVYVPGFYVAEELRTSLPEIQTELAGTGPVATELRALYEAHPITGEHFGRSKVLWDVAVVAWVVNPNWFLTRVVPSRTLDADLRWDQPGPPMREARDLWRDAIYRDLFEKLRDR